MSNLPASPLDAVLKAAASLPAETGESARYKARVDAKGPLVLLVDCSGSMDEPAGRVPKIEIVREAVAHYAQGRRIVAFASDAAEVATPAALPLPSGGTAMHRGLALARGWSPRHTLVLSDGRPDDEEAAIREAEAMRGVIDALYIGPESDARAIAFMRRLARVGVGRYQGHDVVKAGREALPGLIRALGTGR